MSSIYRVLCLNHDPALTAADGDWNRAETAEEAIRKGIPDHQKCELLIGRYSYPLIEVGCPGSRILPDGHPGCRWHGGTLWVDRDWLQLLYIAQHAPEGSELLAATKQSRMECWSVRRLGRLAAELGISTLGATRTKAVASTSALERPSSTVILAARHLDLTESRMGQPGHVVDDSDRSALNMVLGYVAEQHRRGGEQQ